MRLILFDVDGTLVDSQAVIVEAMEAGYAEIGVTPPPRAAILSIIGLSLERAVAEMSPELEPALVARAVAGYRAHFRRAREASRGSAATPLYPGARETLLALAAEDETILGTATGKARRGLDHILGVHGLEGMFTTIQCADNHPSKPHPAMIETALCETGASAAQTIMIGDTSFDMEMGRAAGVATIGVEWGYHARARLVAAGADQLAPDFGALRQMLDDMR